jgi:hypothetical protein
VNHHEESAMKKLLVAVPAVLLVLAGCGSDLTDLRGGSCSTTTAHVQPAAGCTTLAAGTTVTVQARPTCQTCRETTPSCSVELVGNDIELDTVYRQCQENASCGDTGCGFQPISCVFTTPNASAQYRIAFPTQSGGGTTVSFTNVQVAPGGATSCTL